MATNLQKNNNQIVEIAYGKSRVGLNVPSNFDVIEPKFLKQVDDPKFSIENGLKNPINSKSLRDIINSDSKIAISVCDITRAQPRKIVLETIIEHIADIVPKSNIKILIATGTHRVNTKEELTSMLGEEIVSSVEIINHDSRDGNSLVKMPSSISDIEVFLNRNWVEADVRITTGFVEPHFFAGFSGGSKMVAPGLAGLKTILKLHNYKRLKNKYSTWAEINKNPIQQDVRKIAVESGVNFTLDVTLNKNQEITGVFSGEIISAHDKACTFAKETAMIEVEEPYDLVITSNSGYPLDQNLYQTVKGISAAAQITKNNGNILCFSECSDGIPDHGEFYKLLSSFNGPIEVESTLSDPNFHCQDQWQVQMLAAITQKHNVSLFTEGLTTEEINKAFLNHEKTPNDLIIKLINKNPALKGCVLPEGPITIPFFN